MERMNEYRTLGRTGLRVSPLGKNGNGFILPGRVFDTKDSGNPVMESV